MIDPSLAAFYALIGIEPAAPVILTRLDVLDWGATLVFTGTAGDHSFTLRYTDCREFRWRTYAHDTADSAELVSFAAGRDQQRSPMQMLTSQFGASVYYGSVTRA